MQVAPGTRIGSYEVIAPLGAGGMGEVYRARDARLGRDVAIKLLPPGYASNADRLQRFEQEARAAGMLNHPNLLTVYELGVHDGAPYIATELLEGETLRARLEGGAALAPRKAIEYAVHIANGLAAAHEKGIVHRDLKPENLFITRDGRVKILDFGLAKLVAAPTAADSTMKMQTAPGTVMGTVGYMAPEQVRGEEVDQRADIFSFGAILYEMLSGRRAFRGDSSVETMNAILKDDPPELSSTTHVVPPALQKIVDHCLEKSAAARFQSAKDVAFNLETITTTESGAARPIARPSRMHAWTIGIAVVAVALIAMAAAWIATKPRPAEQPTLHQLTFRRGTVRSARFAPDGQSIIYGAAWDGQPLKIFQTRANALDSAPLALPDGDILAIAPSGEMAISVGRTFDAWTSSGTLSTASLLGGAPRPLLENVSCADYSPDGKELAVVRRINGVDQIEWPLGKKILETRGYFSHLRVSPDGQSIAFLDHPFYGDNRGDVAIADRNGKKTALVHEWSGLEGATWSPDGSEVWFTGDRDGTVGNLELYGVDRRGKVRKVWHVPTNLMLLDAGHDGRVLLGSGTIGGAIYGLRPADARERDLTFLAWTDASVITPDGNAVVATSYGAGAGPYYSTYLRPFDSPPIRLGEGYAEGVSFDGKWVASLIFTTPSQIVIHPIGAGGSRKLDSKDLNPKIVQWLPDGRLLAGNLIDAIRLAIIDPNSGTMQPVTFTGLAHADYFKATPDGKRISFYVVREKKSYYAPIAGGAVQSSPVVTGGDEWDAGWSSDGMLYLARISGQVFKIDKVDVVTGRREHFRDIPTPDPAGAISGAKVLLSPDGKTYVTSLSRVLTDLYVVEGLK